MGLGALATTPFSLLPASSCSRRPHPPLTSWGCGQPLPQPHPQQPRVQGTSWWTSSPMAQLPNPAWVPPPRRPSSGTTCLGPGLSPHSPLPPPCPCASVAVAATSPGLLFPSGHSGLLADPSHPVSSFPITMSQPALPSLFPSSLFLFLRPSAASLGLAACHACLLLSALGLDGPASWSRLPLRAPWLCWLTQLQLLSKGWPQGWGADLCPQGGLGGFKLLSRGS